MTPTATPAKQTGFVVIMVLVVSLVAVGALISEATYVKDNSVSIVVEGAIIGSGNRTSSFCGHALSQGTFYDLACVYNPSGVGFYQNGSLVSHTPALYLGHLVWIVNGSKVNFTEAAQQWRNLFA